MVAMWSTYADDVCNFVPWEVDIVLILPLSALTLAGYVGSSQKYAHLVSGAAVA